MASPMTNDVKDDGKTSKAKCRDRPNCCVYHAAKWRGVYQCVVNRLKASLPEAQRGKLFTLKRGVCCCKRPDFHAAAEADSMEGAPPVEDPLLQFISTTALIPNQYRGSLTAASSTFSGCRSVRTFLQIVQRASTGDFGALDVDRPPRPAAAAARKNVVSRMNAQVTIPLPRNMLGHFFGRQGRWVRKVCNHHRFTLAVEAPSTESANASAVANGAGASATSSDAGAAAAAGEDVTVVTVKGRNPEKLGVIQEALVAEAHEAIRRANQTPRHKSDDDDSDDENNDSNDDMDDKSDHDDMEVTTQPPQLDECGE